MGMNVTAIFSEEAYNGICELLGVNWYAIVGTLVLASGFLVHVIFAFLLTLQNRKARGNKRYVHSKAPAGVEFASQNMLVLGLIVCMGLLLHFAQFWYNMQFAELIGNHSNNLIGSPSDGAAFIKHWFSIPWVCAAYLVWFAALWFHLTHGFWSALQTLGWNNAIWINRLKCISNIFATVIFGGFASVVIVFYFKSLV
jgi:succinate dehydrogenase / fumarate reductase cytochrome b subunit